MSIDPKIKHSPELNNINDLRKYFSIHPQQINKLNHADCEILKIGDQYLVSNMDSISEEVELGLYTKPETIGRMAVIACLSDLAACGVEPTHIMQSITWARSYSPEQKLKLQLAYSNELDKYNIQLTGGDTSEGQTTTVTSMAQSLTRKTPLTRFGASKGDFLVLIGELGDGPSLAISYLLGNLSHGFHEESYSPTPQLNAGNLLSEYASACIDTSDGVLTALNHLKNINNIDFDLELNGPNYSQRAIEFINKNKIHKLMLWIVEHGDYQLLATVPPESIEEVKNKIPNLSIIGKVKRPGLSSINNSTASSELNLTKIIDTLYRRRNEPQKHLKELNSHLNSTGKL